VVSDDHAAQGVSGFAGSTTALSKFLTMKARKRAGSVALAEASKTWVFNFGGASAFEEDCALFSPRSRRWNGA
jgi:hypothetical protein